MPASFQEAPPLLGLPIDCHGKGFVFPKSVCIFYSNEESRPVSGGAFSMSIVEAMNYLGDIVPELDKRFRYAVEVRDSSWFQDLAYSFFCK